MSPLRLGIFGGTFEPVHLGHLIVAETARETLPLDQVLFMLAAQPPHKETRALTPEDLRLAMLEAALADHPHFAISTLELERTGPSYTVDTLRALQELPAFAFAEFFLIMGKDSLNNFHTWREPEAIAQLARLVVYPRRDEFEENTHANWPAHYHSLQAPLIEISSSEIRRRVQMNQSIRYLVPENVRSFIASRQLYRKEQ